MTENHSLASFNSKLSDADFARLSKSVTDYAGIQLPPAKKVMVESRLRKRLRFLGIDSFKAYTKFVLTKDGENEQIHLIDAITTNKTDFFREPRHFDILRDEILPHLTNKQGIGISRPLRVWSAGCSSGQEAYTLAIILSEWGSHIPDFKFQILATDISISMLHVAKNAIYSEEDVQPMAQALRHKYLLRSKNNEKKLVQIIPELRNKVSLGILNLMDAPYKVPHKMDIIFCRNVLIYFNKTTEEAIINRLSDCLVRKSYLFLGHSESITGMQTPLNSIASAVYQLK